MAHLDEEGISPVPKPKQALILGAPTRSSAVQTRRPSLWKSTKARLQKPGKALAQPIIRSFPSGLTIYAGPVADGQTSADPEKLGVGGVAALPPIDGGRNAWLFLLGAFVIEGVMWGFPLTFGVFQAYYQEHASFQNSQYLPIVGTISTGVSYLVAPPISLFVTRYAPYQRQMIWGGFSVCILALVGSSFATEIWHLIVSQGILYGIGFQVVYYPVLSMLNEWFFKRRGLAYGIMFAAAGIGGLGLPFLIEKMLDRYGYATTLRAYAVAIFVLVGLTLPFLRGRLRQASATEAHNKIDTGVFFRAVFIAATFSNVFQGLAFFVPSTFIPSYAADLSLSTTQGALVLALMNAAQIFGQIGIGSLSDHMNFHILLFGSTFCSAVVVFLLWGFSNGLNQLLAFGLLYGLAAGGYSVLYCRFVTALTDDPTTGLFVYSIFEFGRGLGNVLAGPVSGSLVSKGVDVHSYGVAKYQRLIIFVGATFLVSSLGGIGYFFEDMCFRFVCIYKKYIRPRFADSESD